MPTDKQLFASHDDIYLKMSITRAVLLNGYFLQMCLFSLNKVYLIFYVIYAAPMNYTPQYALLNHFLKTFLLQFPTSQKNVQAENG